MERVERWGGWWDPTNYYPEVSAKDWVVHARFLQGSIGIAREMLEAMTPGQDEAAAAAFATWSEEGGRYTSTAPSQPNVLHQACFEEPFAQADPRSRLPDTSAIGAGDLLGYRQGNFMPSRVTVTIVGAFDPQEALRLVRERLGTIGGGREAREPTVPDRALRGSGGIVHVARCRTEVVPRGASDARHRPGPRPVRRLPLREPDDPPVLGVLGDRLPE